MIEFFVNTAIVIAGISYAGITVLDGLLPLIGLH